jgi:hypothetical protein
VRRAHDGLVWIWVLAASGWSYMARDRDALISVFSGSRISELIMRLNKSDGSEELSLCMACVTSLDPLFPCLLLASSHPLLLFLPARNPLTPLLYRLFMVHSLISFSTIGASWRACSYFCITLGSLH